MPTPSSPISGKSGSPEEQAVEKAEKEVGGVLDDLEDETGGEVRKIGLDDLVDTDAATGRPVLRKSVDIDLARKRPRSWSR